MDKIFHCVESCSTMKQFNSAMKMLISYSRRRSNILSEVILLNTLEDYAIAKGKTLLMGLK